MRVDERTCAKLRVRPNVGSHEDLHGFADLRVTRNVRARMDEGGELEPRRPHAIERIEAPGGVTESEQDPFDTLKSKALQVVARPYDRETTHPPGTVLGVVVDQT